MVSGGSTEFEQRQLERAQYLSKFPETDKRNLERIIQLFEETVTDLGRSAALLAVGGTLTKPLPRPDIDLITIFGKDPSDPRRDDFENYHLFSLKDFQLLQQLINGIINKDHRFQITSVHEPEIDLEFGSSSILRHDGSIILTTQDGKGTPLEFIRIAIRGSYQEVMSQQQRNSQQPRSYVVLADVKGNH